MVTNPFSTLSQLYCSNLVHLSMLPGVLFTSSQYDILPKLPAAFLLNHNKTMVSGKPGMCPFNSLPHNPDFNDPRKEAF